MVFCFIDVNVTPAYNWLLCPHRVWVLSVYILTKFRLRLMLDINGGVEIV